MTMAGRNPVTAQSDTARRRLAAISSGDTSLMASGASLAGDATTFVATAVAARFDPLVPLRDPEPPPERDWELERPEFPLRPPPWPPPPLRLPPPLLRLPPWPPLPPLPLRLRLRLRFRFRLALPPPLRLDPPPPALLPALRPGVEPEFCVESAMGRYSLPARSPSSWHSQSANSASPMARAQRPAWPS
jgi:hypothetical protein